MRVAPLIFKSGGSLRSHMAIYRSVGIFREDLTLGFVFFLLQATNTIHERHENLLDVPLPYRLTLIRLLKRLLWLCHSIRPYFDFTTCKGEAK